MFSLVRAMFSNHRTLCHNRLTSGLGVEISIVVRSVCVTCCLIAVMGLDLLDLIYNLLMSLHWELETQDRFDVAQRFRATTLLLTPGVAKR